MSAHSTLYRALALLTLVGAGLTMAAPAHADSWAAAQVREMFSPSRNHFVRVVPGNSIGDVIGFGGSAKGDYATALFYSRQPDLSYRLTQTATLLNPVAPVDVFVSDGGRLVTIDNWHNIGYGKVVAVYGADGKPVKSYMLEDLFSKAEIAAFMHSTSSRHWHKGPVYLNKESPTLYMMVAEGRDLIVGLETGRVAYCETREGKSLCRTSAQGRWLPYSEAVPNR